MVVEKLDGRVANLFMDPASVNARRIDGEMLIEHHLAAFGHFIEINVVIGAAWDERKGCFFNLLSQDIGAFSNRSDAVSF